MIDNKNDTENSNFNTRNNKKVEGQQIIVIKKNNLRVKLLSLKRIMFKPNFHLKIFYISLIQFLLFNISNMSIYSVESSIMFRIETIVYIFLFSYIVVITFSILFPYYSEIGEIEDNNSVPDNDNNNDNDFTSHNSIIFVDYHDYYTNYLLHELLDK